MPNHVFSVGCDPELFVHAHHHIFSAHSLVPGTKEAPYPTESGAVQVDGVALEFNTKPAVTDDEFSVNISAVMAELRAMLKGEAEFSQEIENVFSKPYFSNLPEKVRELGCNADFNAWTQEVQTIREPEYGMRTVSGHVHIGWDKDLNVQDPEHFNRCCAFVRQLDHSLGVYSVMNEKPNRRRKMYGCAGSFRPTTYGVEYRVPSNFYIFNDIHSKNVFRIVQKAGNDLRDGNIYFEDEGKNEEVIIAINEDDKKKCSQLFEDFMNV